MTDFAAAAVSGWHYTGVSAKFLGTRKAGDVINYADEPGPLPPLARALPTHRGSNPSSNTLPPPLYSALASSQKTVQTRSLGYLLRAPPSAYAHSHPARRARYTSCQCR